MINEERFEECEYSLDDLEQFRDENGFIDLTKAGLKFELDSREYVGNSDRIKNWVKFGQTKVLIKGEAILDEARNYGIYAELIVEELAKKLGIPAAHYDLIKMLDENGNEVLGVLSESIVDRDKDEQLVSLASLIGDEFSASDKFTDFTSYEFTVDKLREKLLADGYDEEMVENLIIDYKKMLAFSILTADTDKHPENVAFIKGKDENGKNVIRVSPIFDSEASLLLDMDIPTLQKLMENYAGLIESVNCAQPRISVKEDEYCGCGVPWKDTLEAITDDDNVYEFCQETLIPYENSYEMEETINEVLDNVEKRIHAKLPENVRMIAKHAYVFRGKEFANVLGIELENEQDTPDLATSFLNTMMKRAKGDNERDEGIRYSSLTEMLSRMERNLEAPTIEELDEKENTSNRS